MEEPTSLLEKGLAGGHAHQCPGMPGWEAWTLAARRRWADPKLKPKLFSLLRLSYADFRSAFFLKG